MTVFDPRKHADSNYVDRAGEYLMVLTRMTERGKSKNGKAFTRFAAQVISGPCKGRVMRETFYMNDEALWRLGRLCGAIGSVKPFELNDDLAMVTALCMRPFKARVGLETVNGQTYARITGDGYVAASELTAGDRAAITDWQANGMHADWTPEDAVPRSSQRADFDDGGSNAGEDIPF